MTCKRPRQYAAEILALTTKAGRLAALAQVIRNMREWGAEYVRHAWSRRDEARPKPCQ